MTNKAHCKDKTLIHKLRYLMRSSSYEDWFKAYQLVQNKTPENIKTFDAFDSFFKLDIKACYINNMVYDLEMDLYNEGRDNLNLLKMRVEFCRWVYQQFSQESDLNIANFRNFEAESLWEIGEMEQAEKLFQDLIADFPDFAYGYIYYADAHWQSNWSYQHEPNYEKAESIYRQALKKPKMEDVAVVQERLDDMLFEKKHPEEREKIKETRLKHIQSRKNLSPS